MLQIEPKWSLDEKTAERWALVQRLPSSLQSNTSAGEWFTSSADMREDKSLEALAVANKLGESSARYRSQQALHLLSRFRLWATANV